MKWTREDMPSLEGRTWVVTGANSGLGLETAKGLAAKGALVVMACRDPKRAEAAADEVRRVAPHAKLELESGRTDNKTRALLEDIVERGETLEWREWAKRKLLSIDIDSRR